MYRFLEEVSRAQNKTKLSRKDKWRKNCDIVFYDGSKCRSGLKGPLTGQGAAERPSFHPFRTHSYRDGGRAAIQGAGEQGGGGFARGQFDMQTRGAGDGATTLVNKVRPPDLLLHRG